MSLTPNPHAEALGIATVGDTDTKETFKVVSTVWDHNGTLFVEVIDTTGHTAPQALQPKDIERARALARRCLMQPEKTQSSPMRDIKLENNQIKLKFAVSRLELNERFS